MPEPWTPDDVLALSGGFQEPCVVAAAAQLQVFDALAGGPAAAPDLAARLGTDRRATAVLADALAAMGLLVKEGESYALAPGVADTLTEAGPHSVLRMVQHRANCLRSWARLAEVVRSGERAERGPSVLGEEGDRAAFIGAMADIAARTAPGLVAALGPPPFTHLLDVGGASGSYTIAFLRAQPQARATLFDLPAVIPMARRRLRQEGLLHRVGLAAGDYHADPLPSGVDLAWVSAIIHQNSAEENRRLARKVHAALDHGGRVLVRDVVMEPGRARPAAGALFAVNMLVNTPAGGTYTFDEIRGWLEDAGFADVRLLRRHEAMDSVVGARKP
ncbi:MAG: methyltransferase [Candidatus Brocadiia bacterium]